MKTIQDIFNEAAYIIDIKRGEYKGPLIIDKPCTVEGNFSTIWAEKCPALIIKASNVTIKNLYIDVIGDNSDLYEQTALKGNGHKIIFENTFISGRADSIPGESSDWRLPQVVSLGDINSDCKNQIDITLNAADDAEIISNIYSAQLSTSRLKKGENIITVKLSDMPAETIIYGKIFIKTNLIRTLYLTGYVKKSSFILNNVPAKKYSNSENFIEAVKGQRVFIPNNSIIDIKYIWNKSPLFEVDGYAFLLNGNEKAANDYDLIFFSNKRSDNDSVIINDDNEFHIELKKIRDDIKKIIICYSVYEDDNGNFSNISSEIIIYLDSKPFYRFNINNLDFIKTFSAVEIYRYGDAWKINFIGSGYKKKLSELCNYYGIEVE